MYGPTPEDWYAANRAMWDERVPIHAASDYYGLDRFRAGEDPLRAFEREEVGDVTGRSLLHLQCHFGLDTLSWARHGAAHVVGLDFSEPAVETARALAADLGLTPDRAAFVAGDVYDAAEAVPDSSYDIVYTGGGALCWMPDLDRWAETVAALVAPGGFLYVAEFHPFADSFDDETGTRLVHDYFVREPWVDTTSTGTYADRDAATVHNRSVEWVHPVGAVVTAIARAGLRIEFLHEHDMTLHARYENLQRQDDGSYRFPAGHPRIPLMYSIKATKPAA
jgi:SAM-dependent methyltransferase